MNDLTAFAQWVIPSARTAGYPTNAHLARALNTPASTISRWVNGHTQPTVGHLAQLSTLLGVDLRELLVMAGHITSQQAGQASGDAWTQVRDEYAVVARHDLRTVLNGPGDSPETYVAAVKSLREASMPPQHRNQ